MTTPSLPPQQPPGPAGPPQGGPPAGFYPYAGVEAQLRWWNGHAWEDRWMQVPAPGKRFTWGTGATTAQVVAGWIVAVIGGLGVLWCLVGLIGADDGTEATLAVMMMLAQLGIIALGVLAIVNGRIAVRRKRDRERVGSR